MENPNHPNEPNKAILEPNYVVDVHDPNEMVDIPDDIDLVDYDGVNEGVNNEDIEDEDVEIELDDDAELIFPYESHLMRSHLIVEIEVDDDAELIFPYEVEGDQTPPPRDESSDSEPPNAESSDSVSSDSKSEDEEVDVAAEVDVAPENATLKKRLDETKTKLAWARMERDIAKRRLHESRVWNKIFYSDMVRIGAVPKPPSDDEDTEHVPRKKIEETYSLMGPRDLPSHVDHLVTLTLDGDIIMLPKAMSEARMREVIREQVAASMAEFMENINRGAGGAGAGGDGVGGAGADGDGAGGAGASGAGAGGAGAGDAGAGGAGVGGAGPAAPEITGCTYITFMKCDPQPFIGTEGAERDKVKFATATLQGRALTWWNGRIASMGIDAANGTPWTEVRKWMTEEFCPRSVLQRLEQELYNLKLKGTDIDGINCDVTSSRPAVLMMADRIGLSGSWTNNTRQTERFLRVKRGKVTEIVLHQITMKFVQSARIRSMLRIVRNVGHRKRDCPKLKKNEQGGNNRRASLTRLEL
ncbi:hypothetical protein Tco_0071451 [Tanacetum coccineum]